MRNLVLVATALMAMAMNLSIYGQDRNKEGVQADSEAAVLPMRPYTFFYEYLPMIAESVKDEGMAETVLGDSYFVTEKVPARQGFISPFAPGDIRIGNAIMDSMNVYVWEFPDPERMPLCKYAVFVPLNGRYQIFTLEKSLEECWMFCTVDVVNWELTHKSLKLSQKLPQTSDELIEMFGLVITAYLTGTKPSEEYMSKMEGE